MNDFYKAMKILQENKIIRESNEDDEYVAVIVKNGKKVVGIPYIGIRDKIEYTKRFIEFSTKEVAENSLEIIKKLTGLKDIRIYCEKDFYDEMYKKYENDEYKREYATYQDKHKNELSNSYFIASNDCIEKSTIAESSYTHGVIGDVGTHAIDVYGTVAMMGLFFDEYKKEKAIGRAIKSKNKEELEKDLKIALKGIDKDFGYIYQPEVININELGLKSKISRKAGLTEKQSEKYEYSHELIICDKNNNDLKTTYVGSDYDSDIEEYEGWDSVLEFAESNNRADKIYIYDNGNLETVVWTRKFGTSERFDSLEEADEAE